MIKNFAEKIFFLFLLTLTVFPQRQIYYNIPLHSDFVNNNITVLGQDSYGSLLVGSSMGFAYFDGTNFLLEKYSPLRNAYIISFYADQDSNLFIGTSNGFAILKANGQKSFYDSLWSDSTLVFSFYENIDRILIATSNGVLALKNGKIYAPEEFGFLKGKRVYKIVYNNGVYFFATKQGAYYYKIKTADSKRFFAAPVYGILKDKHDEVWLSTEKGIFIYKNERIQPFDENIISVDRYSILVYDEPRDLFAINTFPDDAHPDIRSSIILIKNKKIIKRFTDFDTPPDGVLFFDRDNSLWFSAFAGKLYKYLDLFVEHYERHYGVKSNAFGFCQTDDGKILVGTDGQGVLRYKDNEFVPFLENKAPSTVWQIFEDSRKHLWFSSIDGIFVMNGEGSLKEIKDEKGRSISYGAAFYEEDDGAMWFTSLEGIYRYKDSKIEKKFSFGKTVEYVFRILPSKDGNYWLCGNDKLLKFDGEKILNFNYDERFTNNNFYDLKRAPDGKLVLASENGVFIYDETAVTDSDAVRTLTKNDGLISNVVYSVFFDCDDNLWIMTVAGLSILDYSKYITSGEIFLTNFGEGDPVIGGEYNQFSALLDRNDNIWLGGTSGILKIGRQNNLIFPERVLKPYLSDVQIFLSNNEKKTYTSSRPGSTFPRLKFQYNENTVLFNLAAVSFSNTSLLFYRYNFHSQNKNIPDIKSSWINHRKVYVINLTPNDYVLDLEVRDQFGHTRILKNVLSLRIDAPFWRTKSFYFLLIITFMTFIVLIIIIRERSLKKKNAELSFLLREKQHLADELSRTSTEYQELFDNAFNPMIIFSIPDLKIIEANNSACNLFNYDRKSFKDVKFEQLFVIDKKEFHGHLRLFRTTKTAYYHFITKMKLSDGKLIDAEINAKVINYRGEEAVILVINDITKEKEAEENFKRSLETLEKTEKIKGNFLAQMSHEIRTPLNVITSFISMLRVELDDVRDDIKEELDVAITGIVKSSRRIIRTVDLMLNKSQLDAGAYVLIKRKIDIVYLLKTIVDEFQELANYQGIELKFIYQQKHLWVFADEYSLGQIFINIIDNAIKYTMEGSVTVTATGWGNRIVVEIKDTGIGIKEEYLPHLFDAFSQEEEGYKRRYDGTGLGLSVVKGFCELNNCEVKVKSRKGEGTTFILTFTK